MNVFLVHKDIYKAGNPYISTLKESMERQFSDVCFSWGEDIYWSDRLFEYDIVHYHWPSAFLKCCDEYHSLEEFCSQLLKCKQKGIKIVSTCHDLRPHYEDGAEYADAISFVYGHSDMIFHLGEYSLDLFKIEFPDIQNVILYHHLYDEIYPALPSREEACARLNLDQGKRHILCMGAFRADEERSLVLYLARKLRCHNFEIIAPAFINARTSLKKKFPFVTKSFLKYLFYKYVFRIHLTGRSWVPVADEDMPFYYAAADLAFVHRLKILNSGNAVMPLLFGKRVCGPDLANVGVFLKKYGGLAYDVTQRERLVDLILEHLDTLEREFKEKQKLALQELSTARIASRQYDYYKEILITKH